MHLTLAQLGEVRVAFESAFDEVTFQRFMRERLGKDPSLMGAPRLGGLTEMIEAVAKRANQEGWAIRLVLRARDYVPENENLAALADTLGLSGPASGNVIPTSASPYPEILSADWGIGEPDYKDKKELLQGYLGAKTEELRASNRYFRDDYPNEPKHLRVRYRWPSSPHIKTKVFAENELIKFTEL